LFVCVGGVCVFFGCVVWCVGFLFCFGVCCGCGFLVGLFGGVFLGCVGVWVLLFWFWVLWGIYGACLVLVGVRFCIGLWVWQGGVVAPVMLVSL
ncbi:hypothetical protein RA262_28075, partial [Pseudomonas syringae pv. tagetis]